MAVLRGFRTFAWRDAALPLLLMAAILGAGIAVVVLSQTIGGGDTPAKPPAFRRPPTSAITFRDVKQKDGLRLTVTRVDGTTAVQEEVALADSTKVERLTEIRTPEVRAGEWVTVFGIPNEVRNFSIHTVVVQAAGQVTAGVVRSPSGFAGHEAARNQNDLPIMSGEVLAVEGNSMRVKTPDGEAVVKVEDDGKLYRLAAASAGEITEGDRIAGDFSARPPAAILVLPGE